MANNILEQQIANMRQSFFDDGILDGFFVQAEQLSNGDPSFLMNLLTTYFRQSTTDIASLQNSLESTSCNLNRLEREILKLKGASASVGAIKVRQELDGAIQSCREGDKDGTKAAVERVKNEHAILNNKLNSYFQMLLQATPSNGHVSRRRN